MQKTVVVTTCSANHLAQAKGLADSVISHNPGMQVMIGLVDKLEGRVNAEYYAPHGLAEAHELGIPQFEAMCDRYDVFELNCAMKPFFVLHALQRYKADKAIFLDSDMLVFHPLTYIEEQLDQHPVLLTPHILTPFPADGKRPFEREMLKNGVFNGGFFAVKNETAGPAFLNWWKDRLVDQGYVDLKEGMFVDQKWLNLAPLFFSTLKWLDHPGCNMAYWNLHERQLTKQGEQFIVNGQPLLFFHFSGYSLSTPELISRHQDRFSMKDQPVLQSLFSIYHEVLIKNKHTEMAVLTYHYAKSKGFLQRIGLKK